MRLKQYFKGKKIVITGGTSGIGYALAERLLMYDALVLIVGNSEKQMERAIQGLGATPKKLLGQICDIGNTESVEKLAGKIKSEFVSPDILINNAGFATYRAFVKTDIDEIEDLVNVNLTGALRCTRAIVPSMIKNGGGQIVNMASIAGVIPLTPNATYCAAKHGMIGWSKCISQELHRFGIHVSVICPGRVETPFFDHETFRTRAHRKETELTVPLGKVVDNTLTAIYKRSRITFIPWYFRYISWVINLLPLIFDRTMRSRIEYLYKSEEGGEHA